MTLLSLIILIDSDVYSRDSSDLDPLIEVLGVSDDMQFQLDILKGILLALKGQRDVQEPKNWSGLAKRLIESPRDEVRELSHMLSLKFGSQKALDNMRSILIDEKFSIEKRKRALNALVEVRDSKLPAILITFLDDKFLQQPSLRGLAVYDKPEISASIISHLPKMKLQSRQDALSTMASRLTYATALMTAVNNGNIDAKLLPADVVRQLSAHNDPFVNKQIDKFWGFSRSSSAEKLDEIEKYKSVLVGVDSEHRSNLPNGRKVFNRVCASCHKLFGFGGDIGPDITGSDRKNLHYILSNIVDPNAEIPNDYRTSIIRMKDNRVLVGIIRDRDPKSITVITPNEVLSVAKSDVMKIESQNYSIMPEGLTRFLTDQELRDLISYLKAEGQVPLP